jgi:protein gp37
MAGKSAIEWTEATWNPIVGCSIVSPGCTNCYAMAMAARIDKMTLSSHYEGLTKKVNGKQVWTGKLAQANDHIVTAPLRRRKPTTYFVNSMGDLFHESIPNKWIDKIFAVMAQCPQHTFQVLTKRAERMREYVTDRFEREAGRAADNQIMHPYPIPVLPNVWLGVSTERQQEADERIPHLLQTPAAVRFISAEPLLGPIDLGALRVPSEFHEGRDVGPRRSLDWVIVGGESGAGARPMSIQWPRELRDQCKAAGVPYFFKQWGSWAPAGSQPEGASGRFAFGDYEHDRTAFVQVDGYPRQFTKFGARSTLKLVGKKSAGRLLDGIEHNAVPGRA